jgi:hypothetical protein
MGKTRRVIDSHCYANALMRKSLWLFTQTGQLRAVLKMFFKVFNAIGKAVAGEVNRFFSYSFCYLFLHGPASMTYVKASSAQ